MISYFIQVRQSTRITIVLIYLVCIAILSLLPVQDLPKVPVFRGFDKLVHFSMYFAFSFLFGWALKADHNYLWLFLIVPVAVGWGIFMEYLQLEMHRGRHFDLHDVAANSIGVCIGLLFFLLLACKYSKTHR
jgi:VanZ family protein